MENTTANTDPTDDIYRKALTAFPTASLDEDYEGQVIIYTGIYAVLYPEPEMDDDFNHIYAEANRLFSAASVGEDNDGQFVIYTDLYLNGRPDDEG